MVQGKQHIKTCGLPISRKIGADSIKIKMIKMVLDLKSHPKESTLKILTYAFICFWMYVGSKKLFTFSDYQDSMIKQPFDDQYAIFLSYVLPAIALLTGILFIFERTKSMAFWFSIILMIIFSSYILLALLDKWGSIPCDCVLEFDNSWIAHLWINGIITLNCLIGLLLDKSIRRTQETEVLPSSCKIKKTQHGTSEIEH
jgi:hypothetical protein